VTLLVDTSGSMDCGDRIVVARQLAVTLQRAFELAHAPFRIAAFNSNWHCVEGRDGDEFRSKLCNLRAHGGTAVAPVLDWSLRPHAPHHRAVVVILSDGALSPNDAARCSEMAAANRTVHFLPVLIGAEADAQTYRDAFGRSLEVNDLSDLVPRVSAWIRSQARI
jgi:Mg-chelatase subunit ChlD